MQVFEGAVTWGDLMKADVEEIEFLFKSAEEINDAKRSDADEAKRSASRARRRR